MSCDPQVWPTWVLANERAGGGGTYIHDNRCTDEPCRVARALCFKLNVFEVIRFWNIKIGLGGMDYSTWVFREVFPSVCCQIWIINTTTPSLKSARGQCFIHFTHFLVSHKCIKTAGGRSIFVVSCELRLLFPVKYWKKCYLFRGSCHPFNKYSTHHILNDTAVKPMFGFELSSLVKSLINFFPNQYLSCFIIWVHAHLEI